MSEYMFGIGRGAPSKASAKKIAAIAKRHDFAFVSGTFPGDGYKHWFAGAGFGDPFDGVRARAIMADLRNAGLADDDGIIPAVRL